MSGHSEELEHQSTFCHLIETKDSRMACMSVHSWCRDSMLCKSSASFIKPTSFRTISYSVFSIWQGRGEGHRTEEIISSDIRSLTGAPRCANRIIRSISARLPNVGTGRRGMFAKGWASEKGEDDPSSASGLSRRRMSEVDIVKSEFKRYLVWHASVCVLLL